jgi:hypothetical protein
MISAKKTMLSVYFSRHGFVSIELLPQGERKNSRFFTETVLPSIEDSLLVAAPRMRAKGNPVHIDNAKPHDSEISFSKTDEIGFIRITQPLFSPDFPPWIFFLFGYLKEELEKKLLTGKRRGFGSMTDPESDTSEGSRERDG